MGLVDRFKNRVFWVALFSLIAITGKTFGWYEVPDNYNEWVDAVLLFLMALGIINVSYNKPPKQEQNKVDEQ